MKDTKRRVEFFSFYDHTGIEARLTRMAERGWLLDKIGKGFWHYRRIEPQTLAFAVCYYPKASIYDPGPDEAQETFYDFCAHTGWTLAAASAQMQVFYNDRPNPVPIDTDPAVEVDAIHQSAKKSFLPSQIALAVVGLMNAAMALWRLADDPIQFLATPASLFLLVCWPALLLLLGVDLGTYFLWRHRALRAAEQGEFLPTRSHPVLQIIVLATVTAAFAWFLASLAFSSTPMLAVVSALAVAGTFAVVVVVWAVSSVMKRKKVPADTNRVATIALCTVLSFLVVAMVPILVLSLNRSLLNHRSGPDEVPLSLGDLLEQPVGDYSQNMLVDQSPLLGVINVHQYRWSDGQDVGALTPATLDYTVMVVKLPALYGLCRDEMLYRYDTWDNDQVSEGWKGGYEPADPAPWGAEEAYQDFRQNVGMNDKYLLCYPDRIVEVDFDWEPTPEQMAAVAEKLGGV